MSTTEQSPTYMQTTVLERRQGKAAEQVGLEPYLVILAGQDQGKQYRLHRQYNSFGRAGDVDINIADSKISRQHGVFIIYPDTIVLEDYQSTNGCFVDGARIDRKTIALTSRIQVGNTLMKIEYKNTHEVASEQAIHKAANTDALTNISNRRAFMIQAQEEFVFCQQSNNNLSVIMCDIDFFKRINDSFGHLAGDQVLRDLAKILSVQMRKEDLLARYGGEEFIMVLRHSEVDTVCKWAKRIRKKIEQTTFSFQGHLIPLTLSIGICCMKSDQLTSLKTMIQQADDALYVAKNNGRNRVELA